MIVLVIVTTRNLSAFQVIVSTLGRLGVLCKFSRKN